MVMVTGAFASMAQNNYGLKLIGFSCAGFAFLFLFEALFDWKKKFELSALARTLNFIELIVLGGLATLLSFRSLFIDFNGASTLFTVLLIILTSLYVSYLLRSIGRWWSKSKSLSKGLILYFLVLIFFLISSILAIGLHNLSYLIGTIGMVCLLAFIVWVILSRRILVDGESTSIVAHIWKMRNKSIVVLVASLVVGLYFALNRSNFIPPLYTSEKPAGYLELVKQSEEGKEKTDEDGKLYKLFDDRYQSFIRKYDR
jgi:hypothetical protein